MEKELQSRIREITNKPHIDYSKCTPDQLMHLLMRMEQDLRHIERRKTAQKDQKQYVRTGECSQCGMCCSPLTLYGLSENPMQNPCAFLRTQWRKGIKRYRCMQYTRRPSFCAAFPDHPADIKYVPICTYKFIKTKKKGGKEK